MPVAQGSKGTGMPFSADSRVKLWQERRDRSQELKQLHQGDITKYWQWYRNFVQPLSDPLDWWRSNEQIPTCFKIIETLLPRYVVGMFDSPEWFTVEARNGRNERYEQICASLLRITVEEMKLFPKIVEALRYSLITGHAWGKVTWRTEKEMKQTLEPWQQTMGEALMDSGGEEAVNAALESGQDLSEVVKEGVKQKWSEQEVYDNVDFDWRTFDVIFPDPTGREQWYIEDIETTLGELQDTQEDMNVYDADELAKLVAATMGSANGGGATMGGPVTSGSVGTSHSAAGAAKGYQDEMESNEGIPSTTTSPMRDGVGVTLWQCWGRIPRDQVGSDDIRWRLVVIANGKYVLRDEPIPTPDGRPPYFAIKSIAIPKRLYGESILKYVGPMVDQQSKLANMRLDEVFLGVWKQFFYRDGAILSDNQMLQQPGGAIALKLEPTQSINDVFAELDRSNPMLQTAYQEDAYRQSQAESAAAASDMMQGISPGGRQTATEVERLLQQGNARHMLQVMWNDYTVKKELLERTWKWLTMKLSKPKQVRMVGGEALEVDINDIQVPIDIIVAGGLFALSKETRIQRDQALIQLAQVPQFASYMKPADILRQWAQDNGWKDPNRFIKTEDEVQEDMMRAFTQQLLINGQGEGGAGATGMDPATAGAQMGDPMGNGANASMENVSQMQLPGMEASMAGGQAQGPGAALPTL